MHQKTNPTTAAFQILLNSSKLPYARSTAMGSLWRPVVMVMWCGPHCHSVELPWPVCKTCQSTRYFPINKEVNASNINKLDY